MGELTRILTAAGDAGAVIVLVVSAVLIAWVIKSIVSVIVGGAVKVAELWRAAAKERNAVDAKRNEIDEKVADTLLEVSKTLQALQGESSQTHGMVVGMRREQQVHMANTAERHEEAMEELRPIRNIVAGNANAIAATQEAIMNRLNVHGKQIDRLLEKIEVVALPEKVRGDIVKILEIVTTINQDVQLLRPTTDDVTRSAEEAVSREPNEQKPATLPEQSSEEKSNGTE